MGRSSLAAATSAGTKAAAVPLIARLWAPSPRHACSW